MTPRLDSLATIPRTPAFSNFSLTPISKYLDGGGGAVRAEIFLHAPRKPMIRFPVYSYADSQPFPSPLFVYRIRTTLEKPEYAAP